jgi:hypothetical protein
MEAIERIHRHIDANFETHVRKVREALKIPGVSLTDPLFTNSEVFRSAEALLNYIRELNPEEAELAQTDGYPVVYGKVKSKNPKARTLHSHPQLSL